MQSKVSSTKFLAEESTSISLNVVNPDSFRKQKGDCAKTITIAQLSLWMDTLTMSMCICSHQQTQSRLWWQSMNLNIDHKLIDEKYAPIMVTMADSLSMYSRMTSGQTNSHSPCVAYEHTTRVVYCQAAHPNIVGASMIQLITHICALPQGHLSQTVAICAVAHKLHLLNHLPQHDGTTRASKFAGTQYVLDMVDQHTFGCLIYVLEDPLQTTGGKIPKWNSRVCVGIYLGQLPAHASTVTLILNPMVGHVSTQFHLVFYDNFATINNIH
jgi:hypothetical protein